MVLFKAKSTPYSIIRKSANCSEKIYPLLRDDEGSYLMECISPIHGRSFMVGVTNDNRYVMSKGNGLSYSSKIFSSLGKDINDDFWGLLKKKSAIRDFDVGIEVAKTGIRTNRMEYVLQLHDYITIDDSHRITPYLLQYDVICPFRITDFPFIPEDTIIEALNTWDELNDYDFKQKYMVAAYVLIKNLKILRDNNVLHNALHAQNYTWALELLDFESSRSDIYPYESSDYESWVPSLREAEIIQTYEVINYIAWCMKENVDHSKIMNLFKYFGIEYI